MSDEIDYERLLAETEAEITQLQAVAAFFRKKLGMASSDPLPPTPQNGAGKSAKGLSEDSIPTDAFFRMGVADAIAKYLSIAKQPRSVQAITNALESGGLPHQSKNLYSTIYTALIRGQGKRFSKVKKDWGLSEWYR